MDYAKFVYRPLAARTQPRRPCQPKRRTAVVDWVALPQHTRALLKCCRRLGVRPTRPSDLLRVTLLQLLYSIRCKRQLPGGETTQPGALGSRTGHDGLPRANSPLKTFLACRLATARASRLRMSQSERD